jgi:hypothetical protein
MKLRKRETAMRKIFVSINAAAITFIALFLWSHGLATTPLKANPASSINPTEMMIHYKGSLPIEQWDAI